MATLYGTSETKVVANPPQRAEQGDRGGRVRVLYDEYVASGAIANGDVIKMGKLPAGARIVDAILSNSDLGTTGTCTVGWASNGVESADPDGIFTTVDLNAAALRTGMVEQISAGFGQKFSAETDVQITMTAATDAAGTLKLAVFFVVD